MNKKNKAALIVIGIVIMICPMIPVSSSLFGKTGHITEITRVERILVPAEILKTTAFKKSQECLVGKIPAAALDQFKRLVDPPQAPEAVDGLKRKRRAGGGEFGRLAEMLERVLKAALGARKAPGDIDPQGMPGRVGGAFGRLPVMAERPMG